MAIVVAVIGGVAIVLAGVFPAWLNLRNGQKEIHVLVNSRLSEALEEIKRLGGHKEDF